MAKNIKEITLNQDKHRKTIRAAQKLGYKIAVCPIETLLVCAKAMQDLCQAWLKDGRVDQHANQAMTFTDLKSILGLEKYLEP